MIDLIISCCGLALVLPIFPLIALAIRCDSPGPIFYRQRRALRLKSCTATSCSFEEFGMLKFRTMCADAEKSTGAVLSSKGDSRVTRVGNLLRATRLDEVPQFINVLNGEMSIVGPRPERPEILQTLVAAIPFFEERLRDVKPGITGLAQVSLSYTGAIPKGSVLERFKDSLQNPYDLEGVEGSIADDMRAKLIYDLAYAAGLERFSTFVSNELTILLLTPWVMLRGTRY